MNSIIIGPEAEKDIADAHDYYESVSDGLGEKFEAALNQTFSELESYANFMIRYNDVRCRMVRRFPFMVHYKFISDKNHIKILGVIHTSLDPEKHWRYSHPEE